MTSNVASGNGIFVMSPVSSVTRAARIEPVTQPGTVYASEAFAAALAAGGQGGFTLEYIGRLPLAKAYGESTIYRLDRG